VTNKSIALLHPGNMGVSIGSCAMRAGHQVGWVAAGRSAETTARANAAEFRGYTTLKELLLASEIVLSVCPPAAALDTATEVAALGYSGIYLDANAISPQSAVHVAETVQASGATYIDGGIIGPPAMKPNTTRLYLSGLQCNEIKACFTDTNVEAITIGRSLSAASALKMCYAGWTKGSAALLLSIAALAEAENVGPVLREEWRRSIPALSDRLESNANANAEKAWRFVGEMNEIADTFEANQLPGEFHRGAAAIYARLAQYKNVDEIPSLDAILRALLDSPDTA
jgi:3-hydroxyisobutyrate dehydrogenase-like beta-hydroxyacid dehydrogenase